MKKIGFFILAFLSTAAISTMQSCSNDGDEVPANHFTYDGKSYPLGSGYNYGYSFFGDNGEVNGVEIMLFSPEFKINDDHTLTKSNYMIFYLNTTEEYKIEPGTYAFEDMSQDLHVMRKGFFGFDAMLDGEGDYHNITSGSITITEADDGSYELSWEFTDGSGKKFSGKFKGEIRDWRDTGLV